VHSAPDLAGAAGAGVATGFTASAIAASIVGAVTSSFIKSGIITFRLGLRLSYPVLIYLLMEMLHLVLQRTALQLYVALMALFR
jgi:hypothetical protein